MGIDAFLWFCVNLGAKDIAILYEKSPSYVILTTEGRKNLNTYTLMIPDYSLTLRMTRTYSVLLP